MLDGGGDLDAPSRSHTAWTRPERPWTASRRRACRQPSASRVRSTITVTALSVENTLDGRQMCSSAPIVFTPRTLRDLDECLSVRLDRAPTGVAREAEMAGDRGHGGVVPLRIDRPRHRPRRELRPWRREGVVLGPRRSRTSRLPARPDPLEPPHPHRAGEAGHVVQHLDTATVTDRHHTAVRAPGQRWSDSTSSTSTPSSRDVTSRTWRASTTKIPSARAHQEVPGGTRRVQHRQGLSFSSLVAADREGPDAF